MSSLADRVGEGPNSGVGVTHLAAPSLRVWTCIRRIFDVVTLEFFYTGLLVAAFLLITWFSVYVVYKLFQGQR